MKKITLLLIATFFAVNAFSAFVKNVPVNLRRPDEKDIFGNQWYNQSVLLDSARDYKFTVIGDYSVIVSLNGCVSNPSTVNVINGIDPTALNPSIKVYSNPVADELSVEFIGNTVRICDS